MAENNVAIERTLSPAACTNRIGDSHIRQCLRHSSEFRPFSDFVANVSKRLCHVLYQQSSLFCDTTTDVNDD